MIPKKIKRLISNAKNQCLTSNDLLEKADSNFDKTVAEAYKRYRISLSKNNSLDFDDLLLGHNLVQFHQVIFGSE